MRHRSGRQSDLNRSGGSWQRRARLMVFALGATLLAATGLPFLPARPASAATPEPGFRFVGEIPDLAGAANENTTDGAVFVDDVNRRALVWRAKVAGKYTWDAYDLDRFEDGVAALRGQVVVAGAIPVNNDPQRLQIDGTATEPMVVVDPQNARIMYSAKGAIYEVRYDAQGFNPALQTLSKWVALPNPGGVSAPSLPSGPNLPSQNVVGALGLSYHRGDAGPHGDVGSRLYVVAALDSQKLARSSEFVAVSAWNAALGNKSPIPGERRDLWTYVPRSCRRPVNSDVTLNGHSFVMRTAAVPAPGGAKTARLYLTCDASPDGTARGILRLDLSTVNPFAPGELAPTGEETFFPGIVGTDVEVYGDQYTVAGANGPEARERIYALTRNVAGRSRRVVVFDSSVGGRGAFVGVFPAVNPPDPPRNQAGGLITPGPTAGAVNPLTGRWYFQSEDGLRYQDGRLATVPQSATLESDLNHPNQNLLKRSTQRSPRVDPAPPGGAPPRVLVWHPATDADDPRACVDPSNACWKILEDTNPRIDLTPTIDEFTLNQPESDETSGAFAGTTSAYGMRARFVRGVSTFWPSSIAGIVPLETAPAPSHSPPKDLPDWQTDPFYYHAGECYARDTEVTFSRVFESVLDSDGLESDAAGARAVALDPDAHRKGQDDDTTLREMIGHPDPTPPAGSAGGDNPDGARADPGEGCMRQFFETMSHPGMGFESDPEDGNLDEFGQVWPYQPVACVSEESAQNTVTPASAEWGEMLPLAISGHAKVDCRAGREEAALTTTSRSTMSPGEASSLVTVEDVLTETSSVREPRGGLRSSATVVVRGLTIAGVVHIDEIRTRATVHAPGYRREAANGNPAVDATAVTRREFIGLSVADQRVCGVCEPEQVVGAINTALGTAGYARAPLPDLDHKLGTVKGTNSVIQKDRLQQSADVIMNNDDSNEWPALEIVIYRDAEQRGSGRWMLQFGGVFSQAKFSVISRLDDLVEEPVFEDDLVDDLLGDFEDSPLILGSTIEGTPPRRIAIPIERTKTEGPLPSDDGRSLPESIVKVLRSLGGAILLVLLWLVTFGPVYVARRRALLHRVIAS